MNRILVPTDFSQDADNGLKVAVEIAKVTGAEIFLMNAINPPSKSSFTATGDIDQKGDDEAALYMAQLTRANRAKLDKIIARYDNTLKINNTLVTENLQDAIIDFIKEHNIELVVMGTSGQNTFTEYFMGNNTEQVIRVSECPVLAVRNAPAVFKPENIVLATDLNTKALEGVSHIKKFASNFNATLHVLHVITSDNISPAKVNSNLESFANRHQLERFTLNIVHNEDEEEGIMKFAREKKVDLIAVITHGRTGLSNLVLGSVTEDLVKAASIPILSVNMDE